MAPHGAYRRRVDVALHGARSRNERGGLAVSLPETPEALADGTPHVHAHASGGRFSAAHRREIRFPRGAPRGTPTRSRLARRFDGFGACRHRSVVSRISSAVRSADVHRLGRMGREVRPGRRTRRSPARPFDYFARTRPARFRENGITDSAGNLADRDGPRLIAATSFARCRRASRTAETTPAARQRKASDAAMMRRIP